MDALVEANGARRRQYPLGQCADMEAIQAVESRLQESSYWHLRAVSCECIAGTLTIRGRVPTYYLKQIAQSVVRKIEGIKSVINLIEVVGPDTWHRVQYTLGELEAPDSGLSQPHARRKELGTIR